MNVVDEYISTFPKEQQRILEEIRGLIRQCAPEAAEKISWGMPTYVLKGNLVHFAMHKTHLGFYPGSSGVEAFESRLGGYKHSKGAIQLPLTPPLPRELIEEIVCFRVKENVG